MIKAGDVPCTCFVMDWLLGLAPNKAKAKANAGKALYLAQHLSPMTRDQGRTQGARSLPLALKKH